MKRFILLFAIPLLFAGCQKSTGAGIVGITVVNERGVPIQNCSVKLFVPVDGAIDYYGKTDVNGYIEFKAGVHSYFDCYVWKGLWEGCDFVEFRPGERKAKNVIIYPPGSVFNGCL
jgi:hypothetical protein